MAARILTASGASFRAEAAGYRQRRADQLSYVSLYFARAQGLRDRAAVVAIA